MRFEYEVGCFVFAKFALPERTSALFAIWREIMRFEKCLMCPLIGEKRCSGPKFMRAPAKDIVEWVFAFAKLHKITNSQLAEKSGIPKGTIDGLKKREDVRHETLYPVLKATIESVGGVWDLEFCPADICDNAETVRLEQELERAKGLLAQRSNEVKERTMAIFALFGLCVGLIVLLLLLSL